jgi:hypothetical protein
MGNIVVVRGRQTRDGHQEGGATAAAPMAIPM